MTAITIPRQYDLTVDFFPRKPCGICPKGLFVSSILYNPLYVWNFIDTTNIPVSNPIFRVVKVLLYLKLQQFLARCLRIKVLYSEVYPLVLVL